MHDINVKKVIRCAGTEYVLWLHNPRMILLAVLLVILNSAVVQPTIQAAAAMSETVGVFEPFIAICSADLAMLLFPLVFLVLMADFPRIGADVTSYLFRLGRHNWVLGQLLTLVMTAATVIGVIFVMCVGCAAIQGAQFRLSWSTAVAGYEHVIQQGEMFSLIPSNIYFQLTLPGATVLCWLLLLLVCILLGSIMLLSTLLGHKKAGMFISAGAIVLGLTLMEVDSQAQWFFPSAHFILKQHFTAYFSQPNCEIWQSALYFVLLSVFSAGISFWKAKRFNFILAEREVGI